jgi:hypothetical protein
VRSWIFIRIYLCGFKFESDSNLNETENNRQHAAAPAGRRITTPLPLTARPHLSTATSPLSPSLSPLSSTSLLTRGHHRGKGEAVHPCPLLWMASTRQELDRAVQPIYHRLYKSRHGRLPQTLATRGFLPNPAAADICGVEEWRRGAGDQDVDASLS